MARKKKTTSVLGTLEVTPEVIENEIQEEITEEIQETNEIIPEAIVAFDRPLSIADVFKRNDS